RARPPAGDLCLSSSATCATWGGSSPSRRSRTSFPRSGSGWPSRRARGAVSSCSRSPRSPLLSPSPSPCRRRGRRSSASSTSPATRIEPTTVNGTDALWIHGAQHVVYYFDSRGNGQSRVVRLAGNVLVWAHGSVTLRLEGPLSEAEALRIAGSVG